MPLFLSKPLKYKAAIAKKYLVRDAECMGCTCLELVEISVEKHPFNRKQRGKSRICKNMFDPGCPEDTGYTKELSDKRYEEGYRISVM